MEEKGGVGGGGEGHFSHGVAGASKGKEADLLRQKKTKERGQKRYYGLQLPLRKKKKESRGGKGEEGGGKGGSSSFSFKLENDARRGPRKRRRRKARRNMADWILGGERKRKGAKVLVRKTSPIRAKGKRGEERKGGKRGQH